MDEDDDEDASYDSEGDEESYDDEDGSELSDEEPGDDIEIYIGRDQNNIDRISFINGNDQNNRANGMRRDIDQISFNNMSVDLVNMGGNGIGPGANAAGIIN